MSTLLDRAEAPVLSTDRVEASSQILALIQTVVTNPDVSVEKVKALWEMQREMERERARAEFDADMLHAQREIRSLKWDKFNSTTQSRHVSYPKIDEMLRPIREKYGFAQTFKTEPGPTPSMMVLVCHVLHKGGHRESYPLPMPIDGQGPKGGGVMTGPQAVGNGTSYGMRYLAKLIWDIPMLVDKDDNDGNAIVEYITESQAADLQSLIEETKADKKQFLAYMSNTAKTEIKSLDQLPASLHKSAIAALNMKRNAAQKGGK